MRKFLLLVRSKLWSIIYSTSIIATLIGEEIIYSLIIPPRLLFSLFHYSLIIFFLFVFIFMLWINNRNRIKSLHARDPHKSYYKPNQVSKKWGDWTAKELIIYYYCADVRSKHWIEFRWNQSLDFDLYYLIAIMAFHDIVSILILFLILLAISTINVIIIYYSWFVLYLVWMWWIID